MNNLLKLCILSVSMLLCLSCEENPMAGKEYYYNYMYGTTMTEYGKGGFTRSFVLKFADSGNIVTLCDSKKNVIPTEIGDNDIEIANEELFSASYEVNGGKSIVLDNKLLPKLLIVGDTLVAPIIKIEKDGQFINDASFVKKEEI